MWAGVRRERRPGRQVGPTRWHRALLAAALALLVALGLFVSGLRAVHVGGALTVGEIHRHRLAVRMGREDPRYERRLQDAEVIDRRFAESPLATRLHVVLGGAVLVLGLMQFSKRIRTRLIAVHRWSGRLLIASAVVVVPTGLYFGVLQPYGGAGEALAASVFGGFCLVALGRAYVAIRRREIARHREWMIRAFAVLVGVSTVRVVGALLDLGLSPAGWGARELFVTSLWVGWLLTLVFAEVWIRWTRRAPEHEPRVPAGVA